MPSSVLDLSRVGVGGVLEMYARMNVCMYVHWHMYRAMSNEQTIQYNTTVIALRPKFRHAHATGHRWRQAIVPEGLAQSPYRVIT